MTTRLRSITLKLQELNEQGMQEGIVEFVHDEVIEHAGKEIVVGTTRAVITHEALRAQQFELPIDEARIVRGPDGSRLKRSGKVFDELFAHIAEAQRRDAEARAAANAAAEARAAAKKAELDAQAKQLEADRAAAETTATAEREQIETAFAGRARPG